MGFTVEPLNIAHVLLDVLLHHIVFHACVGHRLHVTKPCKCDYRQIFADRLPIAELAVTTCNTRKIVVFANICPCKSNILYLNHCYVMYNWVNSPYRQRYRLLCGKFRLTRVEAIFFLALTSISLGTSWYFSLFLALGRANLFTFEENMMNNTLLTGSVWAYRKIIVYANESALWFKVEEADVQPTPPGIVHQLPIFRPQWAKDTVPHLPFVQTQIPDSNPILGTLGFASRKAPVVITAARTFKLADHVHKKWMDVKRVLTDAISILVTQLGLLLPIDIGLAPKASSRLALARKDSYDSTKHAVLLAQKCLILDAAFFSYLVAQLKVQVPSFDIASLLSRRLNQFDLNMILKSSIISWKAI